LTATAGAAMTAGCGIQLREIAPSPVSILKIPTYDQSIYGTMRGLLVQHLGDVRGRIILLKPNLVEFEPGSSINTHPMLVHAAYEAFRAMGAASVLIAEGPGHRRNTLDLAEAAGYFRTVPDFENHFVDLNLDEVTRVRPEEQFSRIKKLYLPNSALRADLLVSMAKIKEHATAGVTLSIKNLFGITPTTIYGNKVPMDEPAPVPYGGRQEIGHNGSRQPPKSSPAEKDATSPRQAGYRIPRIVADLSAAIMPGLEIIEGIESIAGAELPRSGTTVAVSPGILVAGTNPVSTDAVAMAVMGFDPMAERGTMPFEACDNTLRLAEDLGVGTRDLSRIEVVGAAIKDVAFRFRDYGGPRQIRRPAGRQG